MHSTIARPGLPQPHCDWLPATVRRDEHGFVLTGSDVAADWPLARRPYLLETSMPGVFAARDVRRGSVKRVASAVGEGSIAIQLLHALFTDDGMTPTGRASSAHGLPASVAEEDRAPVKQ